jgi:hypothetical protein
MTVQKLRKAKMKLLREKTDLVQRLTQVQKSLCEDIDTLDGVQELADEEEYLSRYLKICRDDLEYVLHRYDEVTEVFSLPGNKAMQRSKWSVHESQREGLHTAQLPDESNTPNPVVKKEGSNQGTVKKLHQVKEELDEDYDDDFDDSPCITRRDTKSRCSLGKANNIVFDWLRCLLRLQAHFTTIERQLVEAKAGVFTSKEFQPDADPRMALCTKLLKTLEKCSEVHLAAVDAAYASGHSWNHVKNVLMARFCRRPVLKAAYEKEFDSLRFEGYSRVDEYLRKTSRLYHLFVDVFKDDKSERRVLIRKIVNLLPSEIAARVIERIKSYGKSTGRLGAYEEEWD